MSRNSTIGFALVAALIGIGGGYRLGAGSWTAPKSEKPIAQVKSQDPAAARKVLYWKDPDGKADFSPNPKKTSDGRDYLAVHDEEEPQLAGAQVAKREGKAKLLYYRNPMGLADTSPVPKKDWMGMDYIAVYEGGEESGSTVRVSLDKVQRAGVRAEVAAMRHLVRPMRAPGVAKPDERTLLSIALRADSFIEKLYVNETGRHVKKGEPLFRIYSPDMVKVQFDYRISSNAPGNHDEKGALRRLENLQMPQPVLDELKRTREPVISFDWPSPVSGVVMQKKAVEGMMMKAGDEFLRLADLSSIWVIADVAEQDIAQVRIGATAKVTFRAFPNETFEGRVSFVLHELEMATRTAKVRIEVANPDHRIKHEMFADVDINAGDGDPERLAVPASALIDSGNRRVVLVQRGEGRFEPRPVKVGLRGDGYVEITDGIKAGESVVIAANFLIDAESNLKAALSGFMAAPPGGEKKP